MVDARTFVRTDDRFGDAIVDWPATATALDAASGAWAGRIPVVTGFLGRAPDGRTTTLGRNGSDYTATLLARGLRAREVQIWTDVPGVMTADPALVDEAWPLAHMTYGEALELATFGARMFHPRTMIPLIESGIPMRIRHTMRPDEPGTRVDAVGAPAGDRATSVTSLEDQALIDVQVRQLNHATNVSERVQAVLLAEGVDVWMLTQSAMGQAVSAVVPVAQADRAVRALQVAFADAIGRGDLHPIGVERPVTLLTLVAEAMGRTPNVAGRMFSALGQIGVNVLAIGQSASSRSISCVVHAHDTRDAVRAVHAGFNLTHQRVSLLVLGAGIVGAELLAQVAEQREELKRERGLHPVVVGIATSRRLLFDRDGLDLDGWRERLADEPEATPARFGPVTPDVLDRLARLTGPVLVDCTAADGMEELYEQAFARGIHVVAANKKPLTTPQARRDALLASARQHHRGYRYETTVGASLPVIGTLQDLVQTGDEVHLVEGSLSGTLGFLTNALMDGVRLDAAVRDAKEKGYTEPLPQDDLSGLDAARKGIILARELGFELELDDVALTPFVPAELLAERDLEAFYRALAGHADELARTLARLREEGRVLRYLARVDPSAPSRGEPVVTVGPVGVPSDHPAAGLRGSESFVAFHTRRYQLYPLIVRGAGAGGAVTAAGVLADVLRTFPLLRG
jgi:aspartokinase/homoserine dehydrogenase 1